MFNKRKIRERNNSIPKQNTPKISDLKFVEKCEDSEKFKKLNEEIPVVPIVFTSKGNFRSPGLIDFPIDFSSKINLNVFGKNTDDILSSMDKSLLIDLHYNNLNITQIQVENYIKQESFMNFCAAFNAFKYNHGYFEMIPILEKVKEKIDNSVAIKQLTSQFFIYNADKAYTTVNISDEQRKQTMSYVESIDVQLAQAICTEICLGADEAINDIIMQVNFVPNIKVLYKHLAEDNDFLYELNKTSPEDYPTFVAIYLKTIMRDMIKDVMCRSIGPGITNIMTNIVLSLYYVFDDYLYYDYEAAHEQIKRINKEVN